MSSHIRITAFRAVITLSMIALSCISAYNQTANFTAFPEQYQLYPRNLSTNQAQIIVAGLMYDGNQSARLNLRIWKDGTLFQATERTLNYSGSSASFFETITLEAGLFEYRIEAYAVFGNASILLKEANQVLVGDAYLVSGQSNAKWPAVVAPDGRYIREYEFSWSPASNGIGAWAGKLAADLVQSKQIPVAFTNTAEDGRPISYFKEFTQNWTITTSAVKNRGLSNHIRGFFWFQGEADVNYNTTQGYTNDFVQLVNSYQASFGPIEHTYIMQIRSGCSAPNADQIQEAQRLLPNILPRTTTVSTQGLVHDGCHFSISGGYEVLAEYLKPMVLKDLYNSPDLGNTESADIATAHKAGTNTIKLTTKDSRDQLIFENGAHADFYLTNAPGITVVSGYVINNAIFLQLSDELPSGAQIGFRGHEYSPSPTIKNIRNTPILLWRPIPVTDGPPPFDCNQIACQSVGGEIFITGLDSANAKVEVFDSLSNSIKIINQIALTDTLRITDIGPGTYRIKVTVFSTAWQEICNKETTVVVSNLAPVSPCTQVQISKQADRIGIQQINAPYAIVQVFDRNWNTIFYCADPSCMQSAYTISVQLPGTYYLKVSFFDANWQKICEKVEALDMRKGL